jgi:anaphase-promoting complex subunit 2
VLPLVHKNSQIRVKYHEIDLVTVLVNLYGSQEAFITEYQNMLAEKLMSAKDYNIDEEIKNLEQLKIRFGESALQTCNIIVKDVKDSRRTDNLIHKEPKTVTTELLSPDNLHCLEVSKGYWPINYDSSSHGIPESLKPVFDDYATKFTKTKAMRKIQFHYNLGYVNLSLSFDNGEFTFKCLPIHAILISCFADKGNITG